MPRRPLLPVPVLGVVLADPGPLPEVITAPRFLAGVQHEWHAIDPLAVRPPGFPGCHAHAGALCGDIVRIARDDLQPYRPGEPPQSFAPCPACRWEVAATTNTQAAALVAMSDRLAQSVAAAILVWARDEGRDLDDGRTLQLLAHVSRHEPVLLTAEGCAEGDCDHEDGQCPGNLACQACSLQASGWAGEWEGTYLDECTIPAPCGVLLAIAAHYGVQVPEVSR